MNNVSTRSERPWYTEPWPWILASFPLAAVIGGLITAWIAVKTDDGLVEDDYYKHGLAINQTLGRDKEAGSLHLSATLSAQANGQTISLRLTGALPRYPERLKLRILHPTRAGRDQSVALTRTGQETYTGKGVSLTAGRWDLVLEDDARTWRLLGAWKVPQAREVRLMAGISHKVF